MRVLPLRRGPRGWWNPLLAGGLCALGYVELLTPARYQGVPVWPGPEVANVFVVAGATLPLAWRGRMPTAAPTTALAVLCVAALALGGGEATTTFLVLIVAAFTLAAHGRSLPFGAAALIVVTVVHDLRDPQVNGVGDVVWAAGIVLVAWLVGLAVRTRQLRIGDLESRAQRLEREHAEHVTKALAAERAAIARELHDIVSHLVAVIVIQAQVGARALPADVGQAATALDTIESSGRTALGELRQLLTMLGEVPSPQQVPLASLGRLDELARRCRDAGLEVALATGPLPSELPLLCDATAYRIIQESLTNTLRHAPGAVARVTITSARDTLEIVVDDSGGASVGEPGVGRGLIGMRERAALLGGTVQAGRTGRGWQVRAELPVHGRSRTGED